MYETIRGLLDRNEFSVIESFEIPGRPARYSPVPPFLFDSKVGGHLDEKFKSQLWAHQAQALEALGREDNVVISTGTASGKSLVFRALALHKVLLDPSSRIVVFYPLKALVADQLRGWREMARTLGLDENTVGQIDGSVKDFKAREDILQQARIVVMTPDVCQAWLMARLAMPVVKKFIDSLSTLVMDEAHTLEGVFGSNFAFLLRRMIAARNHLLGAKSRSEKLQLVATTATISNPGEHLKQLTGEKFTVVDHEADGAPHYGRIVAHIACTEGKELEIAKELQHRALINGKDGAFITFLDSRKGVETLAMSTQKDIDDMLGGTEVASYRSGFTSENRQRIEQQLRSGHYRGVVSTSALEMGIDFSNLRVGFNVGVPPTRKAYRQRLGRIGRSGPGAFVVIGPPNAFRRYGISFENYHDMSVEPSYLYLDNRFMQFAHGRCLSEERDALAAPARLPSRVKWPSGFGDIYSAARPGGSRPPEFDAIAELGSDTPQRNYPLRNVGEVNLQIKLHENTDSLGDATQSQALRECYPGATYFHMMHSYEVAAWRTATINPFVQVKRGIPGRSTRPRITTWINTGITTKELIEGHLIRGNNGFLAECQMLITERVDGYYDGRTGEFHSYQELQQRNPNMKARSRNFRTSGVVLCIEEDWFKKSAVKRMISDRLLEVFGHEYSILPQDVGSGATNISVRSTDGSVWRGGCIAVFDETYGSLRLTEKLYIEFNHILERLALATEMDVSPETKSFLSIVKKIKETISGFSASNPLLGPEDESPRGYEQIFTEGSRVCYRESGTIATDVEIIQPTIMNGELMYQVKTPQRPGQRPTLRWISASSIEPSADSDVWEYAWWNRETETYENPPDDGEKK